MRSFAASRRRDVVIVLVSLAVMVIAALTLFRSPAPANTPPGAGMSYQLVYDARGVAAERYRVPGLPETFFLSSSAKRIIGINVAALTAHGLTSILDQLYPAS
jgi:hypothetical protein